MCNDGGTDAGGGTSSSSWLQSPGAAATRIPLKASPSKAHFHPNDSLLNGTFDEEAGRASFQEARLAFLNRVASPSSSKTAQASSSSSSSSASHWSVSAAQGSSQLASLLFDDAPSTKAPAPDMVRVGCYECYKMFVRDTGFIDEPTQKSLCSPKCWDAYMATAKIVCNSKSCRRPFPRQHAVLEEPGPVNLWFFVILTSF